VNTRAQVYVSWLACAAFAFGVLPALVATTGWLGLVKFWLMPWLGYHFWMSTFTVSGSNHSRVVERHEPQCEAPRIL
jgi:fatty acid desaturase